MVSPPYPNAFPIDAAKLVIDKLRGGNAAISQVVHAGWVMVGYSLSVALPTPNIIGDGQIDDVIAAEYLESQINPRIVGVIALPWKLLASYLAKKLVEWILEQQIGG